MGAAHGHDGLARFELAGIAQLDVGQFALHVQLEHGEIGEGIDADDFGIHLISVTQYASDHFALTRDVFVGHDVTVGRDNEATADDEDFFALALGVDLFHGADMHQGGGDNILRVDNGVLRTGPGRRATGGEEGDGGGG